MHALWVRASVDMCQRLVLRRALWPALSACLCTLRVSEPRFLVPACPGGARCPCLVSLYLGFSRRPGRGGGTAISALISALSSAQSANAAAATVRACQACLPGPPLARWPAELRSPQMHAACSAAQVSTGAATRYFAGAYLAKCGEDGRVERLASRVRVQSGSAEWPGGYFGEYADGTAADALEDEPPAAAHPLRRATSAAASEGSVELLPTVKPLALCFCPSPWSLGRDD
jgi:hypothetical protein